MSWINEANATSRNHYLGASEEKVSKQSKRTRHWRSYLNISFSLLVFTLSSFYYISFADCRCRKWNLFRQFASITTTSSHMFSNEKACSNQKQKQQPDLQTCLNNSFQLFAVTLMSKFEDLICKIVEKSPCRDKVKGKRLSKVSKVKSKREQALDRHQNQKVSLRSR